MKPILPRGSSNQGLPTNYNLDKTKFVLFSDTPIAICWKCSDSPCIKKTNLTSPSDMLIKGSNVPEFNVCPTKSLSQNGLGELELTISSCIGCGLCVSACPVNALTLNSRMLPVVQNADLVPVGSKFLQNRLEKSLEIEVEELPISSSIIDSSLKSVQKLLKINSDGKSIQLFVRNIFSKSGFKARIRIEGDTNDAFEIVAETSQFAYPIEIAVGGDTLDSTRRILSGCASLISKGTVKIYNLKPILIVDELPNSRSDVYRVIEDMHKYLGLDLKIIPLSILQLLSFTEINLEEYFNCKEDFPASEWYWRSLLSISNVEESDLEVFKLTK